MVPAASFHSFIPRTDSEFVLTLVETN